MLKFKNVGQYCEELSARYSAKINTDISVDIYKCAYSKSWMLRIIENKTGYSLDTLTYDLLASLPEIPTKKGLIQILQQEIVNDPFFIECAAKELNYMRRIR